ncbi:MAG TPA: serine/threonine-protein kinase [Ktedonobacterales bacterium]|nr:serine/threonine-protein kinase [Ktedonobacterales bacterium]
MQASPNRIGKYELISRLGRGGMGEVYKAFHPQLQRYVAIKVLLTNSETDPEFIARFQNEALAVARLRHPNIVQVFDFDIEGDKPYMVMEFLEGETLAQRMTRYHRDGHVAPTEEVVRLFQQLCAAVDYAHKQGMLHRDIKPANVIINPQGDAVLTDFGLAKISGVSGLTASGSVMGTPHYMSPEQGQGQAMDARSDVYSLSIMLYEMLAGKLPFDADTPVGVIMQHIMATPPPIEQANPAVPSALAQVALVGMAKQPEERFRSAGAMGAAIASAVNAPPMRISTAAPADPLATFSANPDLAPTKLAEKPGTPAQQATGGNIGSPPAGFMGSPPAGARPAAPGQLAPGSEQPRRKPGNSLGRYAVIGIILLLIIIGGGILLIALGNKTTPQTNLNPAASNIGSVTFSDSDPNDFSHPANTLQATFSNMRQPTGGSTYFAWLCDSGSSTCALVGAVLVQRNGSATLKDSQANNLLGVSNLAKLATNLTFEITQEQTESSSPPSKPSQNVIYSGQIVSNVLLHIRHQLAAFPNKGELFPGNTTALDTGLGVDATLLNQLAQQLQAASTLTDQQVAAEEMLNLIAGKAGQKDWNQDGQTSIAQGDDGFGMGTNATVNASTCSGQQNSSYLSLTMQHACLAAKASGTANLSSLFNKIKAAGANIAAALATVQTIAQKIAQATNANAFSQGDVNTLVQTADAILNGVTGETSQQDGARQILLYSEAMATITVNAA